MDMSEQMVIEWLSDLRSTKNICMKIYLIQQGPVLSP